MPTELEPISDKPQNRLIEMAKVAPQRFVHKLMAEGAPSLQKRADQWRRYRSKYRTALRYLADGQIPTTFPANYIFGIVNTVKASATRTMSAVAVRSVDVDDRVGDDLLTKLLQFSIERVHLKAQLKNGALFNGALTGIGWLKVAIDDAAFYGQTDNTVMSYPPEAIIVDPRAVPFYDGAGRVNARYIIEVTKDVPLEEIENEFGGKISFSEEEAFDPNSGFEANKNGTYGEQERSSVGKVADRVECWFNTYDREKPWWRIVLWGNKVIRKAEESPYDHPHPPYVPVFVGYDDNADNFALSGIGVVEEVEPLQDKANTFDQQIFKNVKQIINRQRVINRGLGLTKELVDNTDGRVYEVAGNPKEAIHWDTPPMLTSDVYGYRMQVDYQMEVVTNVTGSQAGRKPTGIQAAKAVTQLTQNADRTIDDLKDDLAFVKSRVGEMMLSNIFQFWTDTRKINLMDGGGLTVIGDWPDGLKLPEDPEDLMYAEIKKQQEEWKTQNGISLVLSDLKRNFAVEVSADSPLPEDRNERMQIVGDLVRLKLIDRRGALEAVSWPGRDEILRRMGDLVEADNQPNQQLIQQIVQTVLQQVMATMQAQMGGGMAGQPQPAQMPGQMPAQVPPVDQAATGGEPSPEQLAQYLTQGVGA